MINQSSIPSSVSAPLSRVHPALLLPALGDGVRHAELEGELPAEALEAHELDAVLGCKKGFELNLNFKHFWIFELSPYLELSNLQRA